MPVSPSDAHESHEGGGATTGLGRWWPLVLFGALLSAAAVARWADAGPLLSSLLAAPLYFLVPLGIGLAALGRRGTMPALSSGIWLVSAYFVGLALLITAMVARERFLDSFLSVDVPFALALAAAALGFLPGKAPVLASGDVRRMLADLMMVLPVFLFGYAFRFGVYSDYPLTDLFQLTHLLKGSLELAYFDRLNPFTADSYAPAIQSMLGLLARVFHAGMLESVWIISLLSYPLIFLCLREALKPFVETRAQLLLALAVGMCFAPRGMLTNGDLAAMGSLALFGMICASARTGHATQLRSAMWAVGGLAAGYLLSRAHLLAFVTALSLVLAGYRLSRPAWLPGAMAFAGLAFALAPLHRGMLVFLPIALISSAIVTLAGKVPPRTLLRLTLATSAMVAILAASVLYISVGPEQTEGASLRFYDKLVSTILGISTVGNPDVMIGAGPKVALFEVVRTISPSLVVATGLLIVLACARRQREQAGQGHWTSTCAAVLQPALPPLMAALLLLGVLLMGIPFIHRASFFLWVLGAVVFARSALPDGRAGSAAALSATVAVCLGYVAAALVLGYRCALLISCPGEPYLDLGRPYFLGSLALLVIAALAGMRSVRRAPSAATALLASTLVAIFAFEFAVNRAYFMPYAYGRPADRVVTHLSSQELAFAKRLRALRGEPALLSDPVTLANLSAMTGLNGMVGFSNLDTMQPHVQRAVRAWLGRTLFPGDAADGGPRTCAPVSPLNMTAQHGNAPAFNYALARHDRPSSSGAEVLRHFDYRPSLLPRWIGPQGERALELEPDAEGTAPMQEWLTMRSLPPEPDGILLVITSRTLAWQGGTSGKELAYAGRLSPLPPGLAASLARRCNVKFNDPYFVVIQFAL